MQAKHRLLCCPAASEKAVLTQLLPKRRESAREAAELGWLRCRCTRRLEAASDASQAGQNNWPACCKPTNTQAALPVAAGPGNAVWNLESKLHPLLPPSEQIPGPAQGGNCKSTAPQKGTMPMKRCKPLRKMLLSIACSPKRGQPSAGSLG